jgi:hypothetical protein
MQKQERFALWLMGIIIAAVIVGGSIYKYMEGP